MHSIGKVHRLRERGGLAIPHDFDRAGLHDHMVKHRLHGTVRI